MKSHRVGLEFFHAADVLGWAQDGPNRICNIPTYVREYGQTVTAVGSGNEEQQAHKSASPGCPLAYLNCQSHQIYRLVNRHIHIHVHQQLRAGVLHMYMCIHHVRMYIGATCHSALTIMCIHMYVRMRFG